MVHRTKSCQVVVRSSGWAGGAATATATGRMAKAAVFVPGCAVVADDDVAVGVYA